MFGRAAELADVLGALRDRSLRLLTVTGRGGVGKPRLVVEVMHALDAQEGRRSVGVALGGVSSPPRPRSVTCSIGARTSRSS